MRKLKTELKLKYYVLSTYIYGAFPHYQLLMLGLPHLLKKLREGEWSQLLTDLGLPLCVCVYIHTHVFIYIKPYIKIYKVYNI